MPFDKKLACLKNYKENEVFYGLLFVIQQVSVGLAAQPNIGRRQGLKEGVYFYIIPSLPTFPGLVKSRPWRPMIGFPNRLTFLIVDVVGRRWGGTEKAE